MASGAVRVKVLKPGEQLDVPERRLARRRQIVLQRPAAGGAPVPADSGTRRTPASGTWC
jgi:hypothetical protein